MAPSTPDTIEDGGAGEEEIVKIFNPDAEPVTGTWYTPSIQTTWQIQLLSEINTSYKVDLYIVDLFDVSLATIQTLKAQGTQVICYFSAGTYENWRIDNNFPPELLGNNLVEWDGERWLDIRNESLAIIMQGRLDLAVQKGCDGVDPDNLDGYTNDTGFPLTARDQLGYNKFIANEAHKRGLAVGLKNSYGQINELEPFFDFSLSEQCHIYNTCDTLQPFIYAGKPVLNAEYDELFVKYSAQRTLLCEDSASREFQTLVLPVLLDDSFRYSCSDE